MQNFNNSDEHLNNNAFTNQGQGNLAGQIPQNFNNQPTIIRPEIPVQKVEQAQTFEKPRPSNPQQRSLRPQQNPAIRATTPIRKTANPAKIPVQTNEEKILEIFAEIEEIKKQIKRPGALTRIEKLLKQVLDTK